MEDLSIIHDIPVTIHVELGRARMPIKEFLKLNYRSIIELDTKLEEPVKFYVNGKPWGTGMLVVLPNDKVGLQVVELFQSSPKHRKEQC